MTGDPPPALREDAPLEEIARALAWALEALIPDMLTSDDVTLDAIRATRVALAAYDAWVERHPPPYTS